MRYRLAFLPPASTPLWIVTDTQTNREVCRIDTPTTKDGDRYRAAVQALVDALNAPEQE